MHWTINYRCLAIASGCKCNKLFDHEVHECDCGGKWKGEIDTDSFEVVEYPPFHLDAVLDAIYGELN